MPDKDGNETFIEKLYRKCSKEPLVPVGSIATLVCLGAGLRAFHSGEKFKAQQLMRGRVLAQGMTRQSLLSTSLYYNNSYAGFTVMVMMIGAYTGNARILTTTTTTLLLLIVLLLTIISMLL